MFRDEFLRACDAAKAGEEIRYHFGHLMADRQFGPKFLEVEAVARAAFDAMEAGKVHLIQKRSLGRYFYIAVKRAAPFKPIEWEGCYATFKPHTKPTRDNPRAALGAVAEKRQGRRSDRAVPAGNGAVRLQAPAGLQSTLLQDPSRL